MWLVHRKLVFCLRSQVRSSERKRNNNFHCLHFWHSYYCQTTGLEEKEFYSFLPRPTPPSWAKEQRKSGRVSGGPSWRLPNAAWAWAGGRCNLPPAARYKWPTLLPLQVWHCCSSCTTVEDDLISQLFSLYYKTIAHYLSRIYCVLFKFCTLQWDNDWSNC